MFGWAAHVTKVAGTYVDRQAKVWLADDGASEAGLAGPEGCDGRSFGGPQPRRTVIMVAVLDVVRISGSVVH